MKERLLVLIAMAVVWAGMAAGTAQAKTIYVDWQATGTNSGASWQHAYTNLQTAIAASVSNDEIWVAQGTYKPGPNRTDSFALKKFVKLYGGFTNGMALLAERNWDAYPTVLSGDIDGNGLLDTNNSYNIVGGITDGWIDGFFITLGYANGTSPRNYGGGINANAQAPYVANCSFVSNYASSGGGGVGYLVGTTVLGTFDNCRFIGNQSGLSGGAFYLDWGGNVLFTNCLFVGNSSFSQGGALRVANSTVTIRNSRFTGNRSSTQNGGSLYIADAAPVGDTTGVLENCVFSGNTVTAAVSAIGGAIAMEVRVFVNGSVFCGNDAQGTWSAGGVLYGPANMKNCILTGNRAQRTGGVAYNSTVVYENCTLTRNSAYDGGALYADNKVYQYLTNSIVWTNSASHYGPEMYHSASTSIVAYTDINGGWNGARIYNTSGGTVSNGGGNLNADPLFADPENGQWSGVGVYDLMNGQTVLTDTGKTWTVNALRGKTVNPDMSQPLEYYILSNTATQLVVLGDVTAIAAPGDSYRIYDVHLKSTVGRWTPPSGGYVIDSVHSPCIDAGDPSFPYVLEPKPNGRQIDMGAYGNTLEASLSARLPRGTIFAVR